MNATTEAPKNAVMTKGDLERMGLDAVDRDRASVVKISGDVGGVSFANAVEVMDFAKLMSVSQQAVPPAFRNNPGMCLAVAFQAIEWRMSPFAVCNKAYVVNDRVAFESQLIHAVIEARAPLSEMLDCKYSGEGPTRQCTIIGKFLSGAVREYTTPMLKDIKIKNSPLWVADPDQQLFYYGTRSFGRKWCPHVLMGIYSKDEVEANEFERDGTPPLPGLHARLSGKERPAEGFQHGNGHVERELSQVAPDKPGQGVVVEAKATTDEPPTGDRPPADPPAPGAKRTAAKASKTKKGTKAAAKAKKPAGAAKTKAQAPANADKPKVTTAPAKAPATPAPEAPQAQPKAGPPTTAADYFGYARNWILASKDKDDMEARYDGERDLRDQLGVAIPDRTKLTVLMRDQFPAE